MPGTVGNSKCPVEVSQGWERRVHARLNENPLPRGVLRGWQSPCRRYVCLSPTRSRRVHGGTHLEEKPSCLFIRMEMPMGDEVLRGERPSCQTDRTQERTCAPDGGQCLLDGRAIPGRTVPADMSARISHENTVSQEGVLSCLVQDTGRISPAGARSLTEIVQHLRLLCLSCLQIRLCLDHREFPRSWNRPSDWANILGGIMSSIPAALFSSQGPALFCHPSPPFSYDGGDTRVVWVRGMGRPYVH